MSFLVITKLLNVSVFDIFAHEDIFKRVADMVSGSSQEAYYVNYPRGIPLPTVPGPMKKNSKIAIIGAGVAGAHMGYQLKKRGYSGIT